MRRGLTHNEALEARRPQLLLRCTKHTHTRNKTCSPLPYTTITSTWIDIPGIHDVLLGRGKPVVSHSGNLQFRALVEKYSYSEVYKGKKYYLFPKAEVLAKLTVAELREIQFSRQKSEYIIGLAQLFAANKISKKAVLALKEAPLIAKELIKIRGVGEWTANYAMMKCLRCPNALTYGDVGLYNALHAIKGFPKRPSRAQLDDFFAPFEGWKAYLVLYLWRSLAVPKYAQ